MINENCKECERSEQSEGVVWMINGQSSRTDTATTVISGGPRIAAGLTISALAAAVSLAVVTGLCLCAYSSLKSNFLVSFRFNTFRTIYTSGILRAIRYYSWTKFWRDSFYLTLFFFAVLVLYYCYYFYFTKNMNKFFVYRIFFLNISLFILVLKFIVKNLIFSSIRKTITLF